MGVELTSNRVRVWEAGHVADLLDAYGLRGVDIDLLEEDGRWMLEVAGNADGYDWGEGPAALHRDRWPSEEDVPDDDEAYAKLDDLYEEQGDDEFLALLRGLAPYLEGPLLILAKDSTCGDTLARAWSVQPGAAAVETLTL